MDWERMSCQRILGTDLTDGIVSLAQTDAPACLPLSVAILVLGRDWSAVAILPPQLYLLWRREAIYTLGKVGTDGLSTD